jgi:hypothetical protein
MTTPAPGTYNFTAEQRQRLAAVYRLILSWRQERIRRQSSQSETRETPTAPQPETNSQAESSEA